MTCCDKYGDCSQSDTCPTRTGIVLPHQAAHAYHVACAHQVAGIKSSRPKWLDGKGTPVPPEAGNFQIQYLGPEDDGQPLTHDEAMALVRTLLVWGIGLLGTIVLVSLAVSYGTERFAAALWSFLAQLS